MPGCCGECCALDGAFGFTAVNDEAGEVGGVVSAGVGAACGATLDTLPLLLPAAAEGFPSGFICSRGWNGRSELSGSKRGVTVGLSGGLLPPVVSVFPTRSSCCCCCGSDLFGSFVDVSFGAGEDVSGGCGECCALDGAFAFAAGDDEAGEVGGFVSAGVGAASGAGGTAEPDVGRGGEMPAPPSAMGACGDGCLLPPWDDGMGICGESAAVADAFGFTAVNDEAGEVGGFVLAGVGAAVDASSSQSESESSSPEGASEFDAQSASLSIF
ncbi:hypothetical protein D3C71_1477380 [compost metagenome]